ncbi:MAG: flagellum-specific ATP synthase FliI, partial [Betaproteobacteria bacterium]|nr:flagellum-specific ATP synthase FliI [Betaproteobacteria bacterium]
TNQAHQLAARHVKQLISRYMRGRDLVSMGAYAPGSDPGLDEALRLWPTIQGFLQQGVDETHGIRESLDGLFEITGGHASS